MAHRSGFCSNGNPVMKGQSTRALAVHCLLIKELVINSTCYPEQYRPVIDRVQAGLSTELTGVNGRYTRGERHAAADPNGKTSLFTDAEAGKDTAKQIVGTERPGDLTQCLLRLTQVLGQQLTSACLRELCVAVRKAVGGLA